MGERNEGVDDGSETPGPSLPLLFSLSPAFAFVRGVRWRSGTHCRVVANRGQLRVRIAEHVSLPYAGYVAEAPLLTSVRRAALVLLGPLQQSWRCYSVLRLFRVPVALVEKRWRLKLNFLHCVKL